MNIFGKSLLLIALLFLTGSCSKVAFEANQNNNTSNANNPGTSGNGSGSIACDVYFNSHVTAVTLASSSQNPDLYADCVPSNVTLNWSVHNAANAVVSINGLQGAHSQPDFFAAGSGVYSITLNAAASGYSDFNSSALTATVNAGGTALPTISCDVQVNGQYAPVNITQGGSNPHFTANCNPSSGSYVWTVTSGSTNVTVAGLTGSDSTPDFEALPAGTYNVSVQVSKNGYQTYYQPSPLQIVVAAKPLKAMSFDTTVTAQNNQLDILLIIDDSNSMLADNLKLADKLKGFVDGLSSSGFDWQMCTTVTRAVKVSSSSDDLYWGASILWSGYSGSPSWVLKSGTANIDQIFSNTIKKIGAGWAGSDDERPIKAAWWSLWNGDYHYSDASGCYRSGAGLAMVMISDEDERSIGGDITQQYYSNEYYPLETDDKPQTLLNQVHSIFGSNKRFTFNSILVRPGDNACMATQDAQGSKSHFGVVNAQMAQLTNGYVGSICDADFSQSLNYFKNDIVTQMQSVNLDCAPVGNITVQVTPSMSYTYRVSGTSVIFDPAVPAGSRIQIQYNCNQ